MKTNYTKGPWQREGRLVYALTPYLGDHPFHKGVERFPDGVNRFSFRVDSNNTREGAPPEELEAVAQLAQAAPELLEALQAILPFIPKTTAAEGGASKYSENVRAADKVRAAIARATQLPTSEGGL